MTVANHVTRSPPSAISSQLSQTIRHHVPSQRHTPNCMISLSIMPLYPATSRHIPVYQSICPPTIALAGIVFKCFCAGRLHLLSTMIYLGMGWLALAAIEPILEALSTSALIWLVTGGIAYTAGTLFYHSHRRYAHAIWHVFVLAGSSCHFAAVLSLVLPPSGA